MRINLSFKENEEYIFNYIKDKGQLNYSVYLKNLVLKDMEGQKKEAPAPKRTGEGDIQW